MMLEGQECCEKNDEGNVAITPCPDVSPHIRRITPRGMGNWHKTVSFEAIVPGLAVRITDHLLALDFLSVLARGDRKKASQTLARINSRPDFSSLLTLRRVDGKQKMRKLISFSNAVQMLLVLPKRTVCMETRKEIAGVLTDFFEYRHQQEGGGCNNSTADKPAGQQQQIPTASSSTLPLFSSSSNFSSQFSSLLSQPPPPPPPPPPSVFSFSPFNFPSQNNFSGEDRLIVQRRTQAELTQREIELERQRARIPIERLAQCMELMERLGPMTEEEQRKFKTLIAEHATSRQ